MFIIITYLFPFLQLIVLCVVNFLFTNQNRFSKQSILLLIILNIGASLLFTYIGILGVFVPVIVLIAMNYNYSNHIISSVIAALSALIILVISDHISLVIVMNVFDILINMLLIEPGYQLLHIVIFVSICIGLTYLLKFVTAQFHAKLSLLTKYSIVILSVLSITIGFIYLNIFNSNKIGLTKEIVQSNTIILFVYIVFIILILGLLMATAIIEIKTKSKQAELKQLRQYSKSLEDMYIEIDRFRHDYINILTSMSEFIRQKDMEQLEKYFNEKIAPTREYIKMSNYKLATLKNMKISEVKGVLVSKIIKAQELGVDVTIEITEAIKEIKLDPIILCRCLGIILDNAIEETKTQENGKMIVAFVRKETDLLIVIANTVLEDVPAIYQMYEKGYSTKGKRRGLGLTNLKELILPYDHITLDTKIENDLFIQEMMVSKN